MIFYIRPFYLVCCRWIWKYSVCSF